MAEIKKYTKKDGSTAYMFQVYLGTDEATGKRIRTTRRGFATRKEASLALSRLRVEAQQGTFRKAQFETYADAYELWKEQYRNTVKESTYHKTIRIFENHILPAFGSLRMERITTAHCQKVLNGWFKRFVHFKVMKNYASLVFQFAVRMQMLPSNPMDNVTMPVKRAAVGERKELNFYSKEELQAFFAACKEDAQEKENLLWYALFRLLAFSGMRKGELLALTWQDIDFTGQTVSINKTLTRGIGNRLIIQTPKTASSERILSLDEETLHILSQWRKQQATDYLKLGFNTLNKRQLVFPNTKNEHMSPTKVGQNLTRILKGYGLKKLTVHGFRHTHCSLLFEAGASLKEVQDRLGHSDVQTTMNIYAHVTERAKERTAQRFAEYLNF